ncbi:tRNA pseudouridine(38-40) synthase TruA, partial [Pseudomonas sp. FW305-130]
MARAGQMEKPEDLRTFRLTLAYIGTNYRGWQKQSEDFPLPTVQEVLDIAIRKIIGDQKFFMHGSGRTDAGVHARAQVAHLR